MRVCGIGVCSLCCALVSHGIGMLMVWIGIWECTGNEIDLKVSQIRAEFYESFILVFWVDRLIAVVS